MFSMTNSDYIISVNNHTYSADLQHVESCIRIGKEAMKGKNAIIAVKKGNIVMLLSEIYKSKQELNKTMAEYVKQGFNVYIA
ncbi:MAG TPA: hypothetical protein VN258_06330 [Mobilitalea sp.]|nr:hypothetical protein [Mobilitalea sp.]